MNELVPSAPGHISPAVQRMLEQIEAQRGQHRFRVSKLVGFDRDGHPDYPEITLEVEMGAYGQYIASVKVQQTRTNHSDWPGTLTDLDPRTACEYYLRLDSVDAVDAVERVMRASTPKAWAFITLLDRMVSVTKEIDK